MATLTLTDASVTVDGNDISDHVQSVNISYDSEVQDESAMGDDTRVGKGGLKNWTVTLEVLQDFASSQVDGILFPLVGTTFTVAVKPTSGATSATNPSYNGTGILESFSPIANAVGEMATTSVSIRSAGTLARSTS